MVYVAQQKKGKQTYYYLVESVRIASGKRKQFRKYLGKKKPSEKKLQILMSQFEGEVQKERQNIFGLHYLTSDVIEDIDELNTSFWNRYSAVSKTVQEQFDENFVMAFVFNSNSIEGSTLTPKEVELLLAENVSPNKPLEDVLEAKNAQKALNYVKAYMKDLSQEFILKLHELYFKDTKPGIAGKYKKFQNEVRGSHFTPTPPEYVLTDMNLFFKNYQKFKKKLHPLELAAWVHWKFVRIHPLQDGNGRISRLLMNFILHKNHYAMLDIKTKEKQQYFKALEKCHYNNNARALALRLVRRFKKQYKNALKTSIH